MKKKILYINQYFKQPSEPGITRTYWISQQLIKAGYEVTMLSHRNTLLNHVGGEVPAKEVVDVDGIVVDVGDGVGGVVGVVVDVAVVVVSLSMTMLLSLMSTQWSTFVISTTKSSK